MPRLSCLAEAEGVSKQQVDLQPGKPAVSCLVLHVESIAAATMRQMSAGGKVLLRRPLTSPLVDAGCAGLWRTQQRRWGAMHQMQWSLMAEGSSRCLGHLPATHTDTACLLCGAGHSHTTSCVSFCLC